MEYQFSLNRNDFVGKNQIRVNFKGDNPNKILLRRVEVIPKMKFVSGLQYKKTSDSTFNDVPEYVQSLEEFVGYIDGFMFDFESFVFIKWPYDITLKGSDFSLFGLDEDDYLLLTKTRVGKKGVIVSGIHLTLLSSLNLGMDVVVKGGITDRSVVRLGMSPYSYVGTERTFTLAERVEFLNVNDVDLFFTLKCRELNNDTLSVEQFHESIINLVFYYNVVS